MNIVISLVEGKFNYGREYYFIFLQKYFLKYVLYIASYIIYYVPSVRERWDLACI